MEQVEGELVRLTFPEGLFRIEADVAVLVVGERLPTGRHGDAHVFPRLLRQRLRQFADVILREGLTLDQQIGGIRHGGEHALVHRRKDGAKHRCRPQNLTP